MPTLNKNKQTWDTTYDWKYQGDEWSIPYGSVEAQWYGAIYPRIYPFLPADTILEIAPGFGRWTQFLLKQSQHLIGVDLSQACITACRERFADQSQASFYVNNGTSLAMISNQSVDFVFSYDSLVHAEADVIQAYLHELKRILKSDGIAWIHHSNLAMYRGYFTLTKIVPRRLIRKFMRYRLMDYDHWRGYNVSARAVRQWCKNAGLVCVGQELTIWGSRRLIDCYSMITLPNSKWDRPFQSIKNTNREALMIGKRKNLMKWDHRA